MCCKVVTKFFSKSLSEAIYWYFSIALKGFFPQSHSYKIFTINWVWIEICENVFLSKLDITTTTIN